MEKKDHRKGLAAMIIASSQKPEEGSKAEEAGESAHEESVEDPSHADEGKQHAISEMMDAFHSKDPASLKAALENFIDMHK